MPVEITDPDLLRQLNGPQEVTDPDVLRMLNGESNPAPVTAMAPAAVDPDLGPIMAPGQTPVMPAAPTNPTGQQLPVTAQTPGAQAFWRGSGQGVTLGAGDELSAGADALRGGNYDQLLAASREANATAQKEHPWAYGTGQVVGGLAGFVPMMAAGPAAAGARVAVPLVSRMGTGAMVGAGLGAVQGFNEGEGGFLNRGGNAVSGAVTGGGIGGLAPAAGAALGSAVQAGVNQLALRGTAIPGMGSRASNTLGEFYNASPAGRIESNIANLGPDAMLADASPAFGTLTQGLTARPEGRARNVLVEALETRDQGTNDRVRASLDQNLGPAPVPSQVEGQFARIRADAGPRYEAALNNGPAIDTAPVLAEIGQRMNTASGPELAALQRARDMLVQTGPDGLVLPRTDPRYLHGVKGSLDQLIEYGDQQIGIPRGALSRSDNALSRVRGRLNDALESQVPGYADANLTTSTAHRASDAFRSGQEALRPNVHPYDFNQGFAAAPIEQQAAARLGMRADLDQVVGNKANDLQAVTGHLKGEGDWNQTKAGTAFGQEPVEAVLADLERQRAFRQTYGNAVGGSKTANTTMAADAVDVRAPSAGGSNADITLGTMAGGPAGTAAAVGVRGARYGLSLLGRRSDIARNDELADALVRSGGAIDPLLDAIRTRGERISSLNHNARNSTQALIEALAMSGDRNGEDKSRLEGTRAAIVKALTDGGRSSAARR